MALPGFMQMFGELIASPSVSCTDPAIDQGNRGVIDLLAEWTEALGFDAEVIDIPGEPGKANLVATLGSGPGGLVLAGHTDTVPFDEALWQQDPFRLELRDDRLYGLGATDMKGFFPVVLRAAQAFRADQLREPLTIVATADEESTMSGANQLVSENRRMGRVAVIGEPTDMKPVRMHKGMMMEAVHVHGHSGHSSNPALGNNALEAMHRVISSLLEYRADLQQRYRHPGFDVPIPTLNLGCIHGGDNPNRICGDCELQFDLRPVPGMLPEELRAEIRQRLAPIARETGTDIQLRSLFSGLLPFEQSADSAIVRAAETFTGHRAGNVAFATESPFLQQLGMETIVMGPGSINQAHQPDEYMALEQVDGAVSIVERLIDRFCVNPASD